METFNILLNIPDLRRPARKAAFQLDPSFLPIFSARIGKLNLAKNGQIAINYTFNIHFFVLSSL